MTELTYTNNGDYRIPDLKLSEEPESKPLGKYGMLRKTYLQEHRPILWNQMILPETLFPHLREIDETARQRLEQIDEVGGRDGSAESQRPDTLGGADEQPESAGRRDHSERTGVQLTNDAPETEPAQPTTAYQMSLYPTEEEQIAYIDTAESVSDTPSAFSMFIPQDDIDHILRAGGNADAARMKITAEFSKQKPVEDRAAFLKNLYYGGNGVVTESGRYSAWYADDGIHIANGDAARYLTSAKIVSWREAAERIGQLLTQGEYATNVELAEAPGHERTELAQSIWYLRQDLSEKARTQG